MWYYHNNLVFDKGRLNVEYVKQIGGVLHVMLSRAVRLSSSSSSSSSTRKDFQVQVRPDANGEGEDTFVDEFPDRIYVLASDSEARTSTSSVD